ncbi:zinc finger and BTB domain-containing protein 49-like isoform X4 [Thunnus maccoyii]|uniref:zinc finger and BTB domain-containing protein 49-like isoform X4 n=1 Tax=Thunnus maccoyii TaxID=8240 RepID=UPI001C4D1162|nr:zinc finger and BTB domain-containing protein 49-like isoform X4 [Thunnus maccoyii]
MCSVVGCDSWRRSAQRFKLPEDPEKRLDWVQFLAEVNGQRFKESCWTDITICIEHFASDCYESLTDTVHLKPRAVPSLFFKSEPIEPDLDHVSPKREEPVDTKEVSALCDQLKTCDSPTYYSEESSTSAAAQGSPAPSEGSCSDTSDAFMCDYGQMLQKIKNLDVIREKAALLQKKGQYVVNEKRLLKLFNCKCPLCGSKVKLEKVTHGILIIVNQQCLECEYRNQWKSQVNASVPTAHLTGGIDVTPETQQEVPTDDNSNVTGVSEIIAVIDEQSDPMDETESSDEGDMDSDEEWNPAVETLVAEELQSESDEESEYEDDDNPAPKHSQLCTECGIFFNKLKPHTCEHKIKPYSCNICGKRCVSETALNTHSRVHDDNYEHRCKYCHVTFKTKVDKITHEQIHLTQGKPYKCPECSETFATNKDRRIHLKDHGGPRKFKCNICDIEFVSLLNLQRHEVVHTGLKPFKCSVCQRGFNQAGHLKSHMRLHTGERPYKCQHCDKSFNHNVSLKSHMQRYHTSSSGCERKKKRINKRADVSGDAQENGNKRGSDSEHDDVEEEDYTDSEVQNDRTGVPKKKKKRRSTGRPIGRPKSSATGTGEGQGSDAKNTKVKLQKLKRTRCSDEESEDEQTDSHTSFDTTEKEEAKSKKERKSTNSDSDSDFDPEERKKKKYSSQRSGKSSGKRRGRPRKNIVV